VNIGIGRITLILCFYLPYSHFSPKFEVLVLFLSVSLPIKFLVFLNFLGETSRHRLGGTNEMCMFFRGLGGSIWKDGGMDMRA
jgi:hypothetical protein